MPKIKHQTAKEFGYVLNRAEELVTYLHDADRRWNLADPPPDLEQAALALHALQEALAGVQRKVLAHVANAAYGRSVEQILRGERAEEGAPQ